MIQNNRGLSSVLECIYPSHHWGHRTGIAFERSKNTYVWSKKSFTLRRKKSSQRFLKLIYFKGVISKVGSDSSSLSFIDLVFF